MRLRNTSSVFFHEENLNKKKINKMCDPMGNDHMLEMWKNQFYQQYMQINKLTQWQQQTLNNASYPWQNFTNISYPHQNSAYNPNHHQNLADSPNPQQNSDYNSYPQQYSDYNPYPQQHWGYNPYPQQNFENSQSTDHGYTSPKKLHSAYINQANYNNTVYDDYSNVANCSEDNITDDDDSECELVFNFDCIMAMRAEKEKIKKEEKEKDDDDEDDDSESIASIEFIDAIVDKNFEFVALDSAQRLETFRGKPLKPNAQGNMDEEMEVRNYLYGDKAKVIAELETSMKATFDQLCDHHQPNMFNPAM
ncbi:hypothetical protein CDAR_4961 [Caerostris darwini]|uniref:Uncharacterized protein n=1 Tax=Caerostris darwini TaxID=1538125 RepID=A0AAV4P3C6_9ARAC|nr:hypothetical protein CDAR_4961 [Caerostris darwini]